MSEMFAYESESAEKLSEDSVLNDSGEWDGSPHYVTVSDSGSNGYVSLRICVPKDVARSKGIEEGDQLVLQETADGFRAKKVEHEP